MHPAHLADTLDFAILSFDAGGSQTRAPQVYYSGSTGYTTVIELVVGTHSGMHFRPLFGTIHSLPAVKYLLLSFCEAFLTGATKLGMSLLFAVMSASSAYEETSEAIRCRYCGTATARAVDCRH